MLETNIYIIEVLFEVPEKQRFKWKLMHIGIIHGHLYFNQQLHRKMYKNVDKLNRSNTVLLSSQVLEKGDLNFTHLKVLSTTLFVAIHYLFDARNKYIHHRSIV